MLRAATEGTELSLGDLDEGNARSVEERRNTPVDELIAEVEAEGEKTQELLSLIWEEQRGLTREGAPMSLGDYLRMFPGHDEQHLAQLRTAQEAPRD